VKKNGLYNICLCLYGILNFPDKKITITKWYKYLRKTKMKNKEKKQFTFFSGAKFDRLLKDSLIFFLMCRLLIILTQLLYVQGIKVWISWHNVNSRSKAIESLWFLVYVCVLAASHCMCSYVAYIFPPFRLETLCSAQGIYKEYTPNCTIVAIMERIFCGH
jgi:hypothetical protein